MSAVLKTSMDRGRAMALLLAALILVAPAVWIVWSLYAASAAAETVDSQSVLLQALQKRVAALKDEPPSTGSLADTAAVYLPGKTPAIAGAALQSTVSTIISEAGGRVVETEFAPVDPVEGDPGRVDIRVSFEADIVGLQRILFRLETGMPLLLLQTLAVQTSGTTQVAEDASPPLRVVALVSGFREPGQ
jgi:hypothetical protein